MLKKSCEKFCLLDLLLEITEPLYSFDGDQPS